MARGRDWLVSQLSAASLRARAVGMVVKIVVEFVVFAVTAAVLVLPAVLLAFPKSGILPAEAVGGAWATLALVTFRQGYCFSTDEQAPSGRWRPSKE